jgi:hypothetical protein
MKNRASIPGGAAEDIAGGLIEARGNVLSPLPGLVRIVVGCPTTYVVGWNLAPLRGYKNAIS